MKGRKVSLIPGNGLVLAVGEVAAVVHRDGEADIEELGALLQICREVGSKGEPSPGAGLARRVGRLLLEGDPDRFPAFSVVAPAGEEILALVHGKIDVVARHGDEVTSVSGADAEVWTERRFPMDVDRVDVAPSVDAAPPDLWTDLRDGTAHGAGFVLTRRHVPAPTPEVAAAPAARPPAGVDEPVTPAQPEAPPTEKSLEPVDEVPYQAPEDLLEEMERPSLSPPMPTPAATESMPTSGGTSGDFQAVSLIGIDTTSTLAGRTPLPLEGADEEGEETPADTDDPYDVVVPGIRCVRNHHNNPLALYCSRCGIKMVHATHQLLDGIRPPLGVITLDDSSTYPVKRDLLLGREPGVDDLVRDDRAMGITITDEKRTVSRAHALIHLEGWDVFIEDRGSANGTFVRTTAMQPWQRLAPGEKVELTTGMSARIGEREFTFDQHHIVG